eukprot:TRINITY_DN5238_c1_g2_i1.p1 TRINITY_DN5238_c1_g2~~TRINITY_DN5238_c1_g2_i1.p1  ORF type:complete len:693 (+),score=94.90 TRINITY_DN5238_c1_g2_i1:43-2121(+)
MAFRSPRILALVAQYRCLAETITGHIYCDNYFEFYFNGQLVKKDPLDFTPHNAVKVSFDYDGGKKVYAILCQDYASTSGYEYTDTTTPQLGDGVLVAEFSDGTRTSKDWKTYTVTFGPTDASNSAGCSSSNLGVCALQDNGLPDNWQSVDFNDSSWTSATEYTAAQAGWGRTPAFSNGQCGTITSPLTRQNANPSSIATSEDECLKPATVLCGGDETCSGDDGRMIWGADLERDNKMLFRHEATVTASTASSGSSSTTVTVPTASSCADPGISACAANAVVSQRVRREITQLTEAEWQRVVDAIWIMKNTSRASGESQFGSNFKPYNYFVMKHAVAVMDSRGDQGHFSAAFATFHAAFVLEFELSLLAIDPDIGALPYWDGVSDVLTNSYFGSATGTGSDNVVNDGKFAHFPIESNLDMADWSSHLKSVDGASNGFTGNGGFLRGTRPNNPTQTLELTRYGSAWTFPATGQDECAAISGCWNDWYGCIEGGSSHGNFHSGAHVMVGGKSGSNRGDFEDPTTSPNDPFFWFHHANVDRNRLKWMQAHANEASVYWGFTRKCVGPSSQNCPTKGIDLGDVASSLWPFSSAQLGLTGLNTEGVTHAEILCHVGPTTAPYTYADPGGSPSPSPSHSPTPSPTSSSVPSHSPTPSPTSSFVPSPSSPAPATDTASCTSARSLSLLAAVTAILRLKIR